VWEHLARLLILEGALMLAGLLLLAGYFAPGYNGRCGGLLPFLGGTRPCSRWEYVGTMLLFTGGMLLAALHEGWRARLVLLGALLLPVVLYALVVTLGAGLSAA
jgi:hypothetical protein